VVKAVKSPRIQKMRDRGMRIVGDTPKEFGDLIVAERKKWGEIITSAHITVQ